jgi:hypothetical protein
MDFNLPAGSTISVSHDSGEPIVVIPPPRNSSRYFTGLFLLFWLGLWAMGFKAAASDLWSGKGNAFLVFWLGAWSLGGVFAVSVLYRVFRPSVPETLVLRRSDVAYDAGIPPLQWDQWSGNRKNPVQAWRSAFPKRVRVELDRRRLQSLRLRETESGNRLTVDVDSDRVEIAANASEVEREWLARLLAARYSLPQVLAGGGQVTASDGR